MTYQWRKVLSASILQLLQAITLTAHNQLAQVTDVDTPAGVTYEAARKAAAESKSLRHLQSAIQIAASKGETEMVLVLLDAGANVDGYSLTEEEYSVYESIARRDVEAYDDAEDDGGDYDDEELYDENDDDDRIYHPHFY